MTLFNVFIIMYDHIIFAYFLLFKLYGLNHFKTDLVYELNVYLCTGSAYYSVMSFSYVPCDVLEIYTTYRFRDRLFLPFFILNSARISVFIVRMEEFNPYPLSYRKANLSAP